MREKAIKFLQERNIHLVQFLELNGVQNAVYKAMVDFSEQETKELREKLNSERKYNQDHVNALVSKMEGGNKTNL